jgi:hypothetical protein
MDPDLLVIVPTRARPAAAKELAATFLETCTALTRLVFAVDADDPDIGAYARAVYGLPGDVRVTPTPGTMVKALNAAAADLGRTFAVGFMGDDHRPRTVGWDSRYLEALHDLGTGIVYGDDLLQGERIPTQVAMTADIPRALGYMAPPTLTHLFVDNFWRDLGRNAECLRYLPDVVVEHLHPYAGKAEWDAGYLRVNTSGMYAKDADAYNAYYLKHYADDVAKVKALR